MQPSSRYYGGIGLALVLAVILALPLWLANANHPLAARTAVDVCAMLEDTLLVALPEPPAKVERRVPGFADAGSAASCYAELPGPSGTAPGARHAWVAVTTQRMLSTDGRAAHTDRFVETWLAEAQADGTSVEQLAGPWRHAALLRGPRNERRIDLLAHDAGVVLWFSGQGIGRDSLVAFATAATRRLRVK